MVKPWRGLSIYDQASSKSAQSPMISVHDDSSPLAIAMDVLTLEGHLANPHQTLDALSF
jgi:hypothetical protein